MANRTKPLFSELRTLDRHELRRVLIFVTGLLATHGEPPGEEVPAPEGASFRKEYVRCGKPGCKSCPHGPYWYAYYREGGRLKSRYIGRELEPSTSE